MRNGKHIKIYRIGTIQLTPSLTLTNALHVPDFHYNLLSASKLAKQLIAHVISTLISVAFSPFNEAAFRNY